MLRFNNLWKITFLPNAEQQKFIKVDFDDTRKKSPYDYKMTLETIWELLKLEFPNSLQKTFTKGNEKYIKRKKSAFRGTKSNYLKIKETRLFSDTELTEDIFQQVVCGNCTCDFAKVM